MKINSNKLPFSLLPLPLLLFGHSFTLAQSEAWWKVDEVAGTASYGGRINTQSVRDLLNSVRASGQIRHLSIDSMGGSVEAGIELGEWVHENKISVLVPTVCMSSCANYVFSAGRSKTIAPGAVIIWHGGTTQPELESFVENYRQRSALQRTESRTFENAAYLKENEMKFDGLTKLMKMEAEFFAKLQISTSLTTAGQKPTEIAVSWSFDLTELAQHGLRHVEGPADYCSQAYMKKSLFARLNSVKCLKRSDGQFRVAP